jgi:hypothetical protein
MMVEKIKVRSKRRRKKKTHIVYLYLSITNILLMIVYQKDLVELQAILMYERFAPMIFFSTTTYISPGKSACSNHGLN